MNQKGFTIIELMVATTTFSVVLLVAVTTLISLGRIYAKSTLQSSTQEVTRNISEDLTRSFQFSSTDKVALADDPAHPNTHSFCVGETKYTYTLNQKVGGGLGGLISEKLTTPACNGATTGTRELLSENMRLLNFNIAPVDSAHKLYSVRIRIAYGDNDLLTHYKDDGNPINPSTLISDAVNATCKSGVAGSSFCAISELDNIVRKRLE